MLAKIDLRLSTLLSKAIAGWVPRENGSSFSRCKRYDDGHEHENQRNCINRSSRPTPKSRATFVHTETMTGRTVWASLPLGTITADAGTRKSNLHENRDHDKENYHTGGHAR